MLLSASWTRVCKHGISHLHLTTVSRVDWHERGGTSYRYLWNIGSLLPSNITTWWMELSHCQLNFVHFTLNSLPSNPSPASTSRHYPIATQVVLSIFFVQKKEPSRNAWTLSFYLHTWGWNITAPLDTNPSLRLRICFIPHKPELEQILSPSIKWTATRTFFFTNLNWKDVFKMWIFTD